MDCLALGSYFPEKRNLPASLLTTQPTRIFAPD